MISVLIPTYNYVCSELVHDLHRQLLLSVNDFEIIVAEDGSTDQQTIDANHGITELTACRHIVNRQNLGRARVMNFLVNEAKGEWCILMDSDAKVVDEGFIKKYIDYTNEDVDVVVGGLVNPDDLPDKDATLRYKYEKAAEQYRTAKYRTHHPYKRFCTFNFMARRDILLEVPFDARCTEYGHEDTLMGIELQRHDKNILHIDNPLMHLGFDDNKTYLKKVDTSLRSLKRIEADILPATGLGKVVLKIRKYHLSALVRLIYRGCHSMLLHNLISNNPNLTLFSFYKLGYYISL